MAARTITGTIPSHPRSMVRFRQLARFLISGSVYLGGEYRAVTSTTGAFSIAVPVPDTGEVAYRIDLPDGLAADVFLGDGVATTLEALMGGAASSSLRTITGVLPTYPRASVRFRQLQAFVTLTNTYLTREYTAICGADGAFSFAVPVPSAGCVDYLIKLPSGEDVSICLAAGAATTLDVLLGFVAPAVVGTAGYRSPLWLLGIGAT